MEKICYNILVIGRASSCDIGFVKIFYYMEVLVPVKEVNQITKQNKIIIDKKIYNYTIYKTDNKIK